MSINLKALRILRVIRPLRTIKAAPQLKNQVTTLLTSFSEMGNAAFFILFGMLLFSILGLQQFSGITHYRCRLTEKPINAKHWPKSEIHTRVCSYFNDGAYKCPNGLYCGSPLQYGISLQDDGFYEDLLTDYGINAFDNFGQALL